MHSFLSYAAVGFLNFYRFAFYKPLQEVKKTSFTAVRSTAFCFIKWIFVQPQKPSALVFYKILTTEEEHNISSTYPTLNSEY